jgi:hypothetical protein
MNEDLDKIALEGQIKNTQTLIELDEEDIKNFTADLANHNVTEEPYYNHIMETIREKKTHVGILYQKLVILKDETLSYKERMLRAAWIN